MIPFGVMKIFYTPDNQLVEGTPCVHAFTSRAAQVQPDAQAIDGIDEDM